MRVDQIKRKRVLKERILDITKTVGFHINVDEGEKGKTTAQEDFFLRLEIGYEGNF
jgi:hypothetical protein